VGEDRKVTLGDGTTVGVYEYGDPGGRPVFAFHGVPSCGAGFDWAHEAAQERGLRLLAPDRPGIGLSSGPPLDVVADYPARIAVLADELGLDRFAVLGYSGGGPYAVACAAELGDRVTSTAVCAGMGQVDVWAEVDDFEKTDRQMLGLCTSHPRIAGLLLSGSARIARLSPASAQKSFVKQLSPSDAAVIEAQDEPPG
jgi:pimeloyl-ACP methyl ester carboxylesterase